MPVSNESHRFYDLGFQYYIAARSSVILGIDTVAGNLYHHAVEMLLKGHLAKTYSLADLKDRFGHSLKAAWGEFKSQFPSEDLSEFDQTIIELDNFEKIRYPDRIINQGLGVRIGWAEKPRPIHGPAAKGIPQYALVVQNLDSLIVRLFKLCSLNPRAYLAAYSRARQILEDDNPACEGWFPATVPQ